MLHSSKASRVFHWLTGAALFAVMVAIIVTGCTPTDMALTMSDTCETNAAVVSALAKQRQLGNLSTAQISLVNDDIQVIDSACLAGSPSTSLSGAAAAAATELAQILIGATS